MCRHGAQGILDTASNGSLDSEFGTHTEEDVVKAILEKGEVQETEVRFHTFSPHLHATILDASLSSTILDV